MGFIGQPVKIHDEPHPIKAPLITPVIPVIAPEPLRTPELVPVRR